MRARTFALLAALLIALGVPASHAAAQGEAPTNLLQPPGAGLKPVVVEIAMHVMNISDIDEVGESFKLVCYLFAQWKDPRLAYVPAQGEQQRHVPDGAIWQPRFEFVNASTPHAIYDHGLAVAPDGLVSYVERSSAELTANFKLRRFPFDQQTLPIYIHPFVAQAPFVIFHDDDPLTSVTTEEKLYSALAQWDITGITAHTSIIMMGRNGRMPEARFEIHIKRRYFFYIWKVFVPLLLMVVLSWTVFWVDPSDLASQVQISVTTILTVIAFAFAISVSLPKVPYLTLIDAFFLTCYVFVFLTAVELTTVHVAGRSRQKHLGFLIRRTTRIVLPIAFVAANVIILTWFFN